MTNSDVVLLKSSEIDRASEILVRAFDRDPMFRYLGIKANQEGQVNANALKWYCRLNLRNCLPYGRIYAAKDLKGVAAWIPPGKPEMNTWQVLSMLSILPWKCGWHRFGQCLSLFHTLNQRHNREMSEPHWMLNLIGVDPTYQGQGIGRLLLQPVFKQADREGLSCYLSTFNQQAVYFYQKQGFIILWQGKLSDDSPSVWTMTRKPQV